MVKFVVLGVGFDFDFLWVVEGGYLDVFVECCCCKVDVGGENQVFVLVVQFRVWFYFDMYVEVVVVVGVFVVLVCYVDVVIFVDVFGQFDFDWFGFEGVFVFVVNGVGVYYYFVVVFIGWVDLLGFYYVENGVGLIVYGVVVVVG